MRVARSCSMRLLQLCGVVLVLIATSSRAAAQVSAAISGVVTDASGSAISAAAVTAKNVETAAARTTATDAAGRSSLLLLPVGRYARTPRPDDFPTPPPP